MRIAYVASQIPRRDELSPGPIDAEWMVAERTPADIAVFVDYGSEGADLLREAGIPVHESPKRPVVIEATLETAEQIQARTLLRLHLEEPFDAIIYDSSLAADWAWHQPRLAPIPRGVALGAGPVRDVRLVTGSPALFGTHGRDLWAITGSLASADFLLGDVPPEAYGLAPAALPPRYRLNRLPVPAPSTSSPQMIVLVALSESPAGLASVVTRAQAVHPIDDNSVLAIIHPDAATGPETTRDILTSSLPPGLAEQARLAEPSSDGVAAGLLAQADLVIAARSSDLAVRAVADAVSRTGGVVIESAPDDAPWFGDAALEKLDHHQPVLVPADRPLADLVTAIDEVTAPAVVLHSYEAAELARRVWRLPGSARAGLILVCDTDPYLGSIDPARPAFTVLGFGMESWASIRRLLQQAENLHEVVEWAGNLTHAPLTNLLAVPVAGSSHGRFGPGSASPAWVTEAGMLPAANFAALSPAGSAEAVGHQKPLGSDIQRWAESHGFRDRVRLALPWKWGLLARAMRGRW